MGETETATYCSACKTITPHTPVRVGFQALMGTMLTSLGTFGERRAKLECVHCRKETEQHRPRAVWDSQTHFDSF